MGITLKTSPDFLCASPKYILTMHRVEPAKTKYRFSVGCFVEPKPDGPKLLVVVDEYWPQ